jgi:hypothetical protein
VPYGCSRRLADPENLEDVLADKILLRKQKEGDFLFNMAPLIDLVSRAAKALDSTSMSSVEPGHGSSFEALDISDMSGGQQFVIWLLVAGCFGVLFYIVGRDIRDKVQTGEFQRSVSSLGRFLLAIAMPTTYYRILRFVALGIWDGIRASMGRRSDRKTLEAGFGQGREVARVVGVEPAAGGVLEGEVKDIAAQEKEIDNSVADVEKLGRSRSNPTEVVPQFQLPVMASYKTVPKWL